MGTGLLRMRSLGVSLGLLAILALPRISQACAVCSAGREDDTRTAFIVSTVGMTLLPLILVGAVGWWLRRRILENEKSQLRERDPQLLP